MICSDTNHCLLTADAMLAAVLAGAVHEEPHNDTPAGRNRKRESGIDEENILEEGTVRDRAEPDRFTDSEHSTFSERDLKRLGVRHDRVSDTDIGEARSTEPGLSVELESLFARLRQTVSSRTGTDPTSEFVGEMERVAATTLHAALIECLASAGSDEESAHMWTGDDAPAPMRVSAAHLLELRVPVPRLYNRKGMLSGGAGTGRSHVVQQTVSCGQRQCGAGSIDRKCPWRWRHWHSCC